MDHAHRNPPVSSGALSHRGSDFKPEIGSSRERYSSTSGASSEPEPCLAAALVIHAISDAALAVDPRGRICDVNQALCELLSADRAALQGQTPEAIFGADLSTLDPRGASEPDRPPPRLEVVCSDGKPYPFAVRQLPCVGSRPGSGSAVYLLVKAGEAPDCKEAFLKADALRREMESIVHRTPAVVFLWKNAPGWPVEFVSQNIQQFGYSVDELMSGRVPYASIVYPEDLPRVAAEVADFTAQGVDEFTQEYRFITPEGKVHWLDDRTWIRRNAQGEVTHYQGIVIDITQRVEAQAALRRSEERYAMAERGANDGLWDWDLVTQRIYSSDRLLEMVGLKAQEPGEEARSWISVMAEEDRDQMRAELAEHLASTSEHFKAECRLRRQDGSTLWVLIRALIVRTESGVPIRLVGSTSDITDRKLAEQRLLRDALYDGLTGLPNRALFLDRLGQAIARSRKRNGHGFSVLFLDLDRFKNVNDSLGHLVGDLLLMGFAQRLRAVLRADDTVARLGGDEFTILLSDTSTPSDVEVVVGRIRECLRAPFDLEGHEVFCSTSIGITMSHHGYHKAEDVLRDADVALYRAKAAGRGGHVLFDGYMRSRAVEQLQLEMSLRRAIEAQEFSLAYQPILALDTRRLMGFEALLRWDHPTRGQIPPMDFIPVAEETGLIVPIGIWVVREACRQLQEWSMRYPQLEGMTMSVNLSVKQFSQPDILGQIRSALQDNNLHPSRLRLEITETVLADNPELAYRVLEALNRDGIGLELDDFGTGFSSLSYLHRFPVSTLKIDRSFCHKLEAGGKEAEIVRAIVQLSHNLGIKVTAEGIETHVELELLTAMGCDAGQGYYFTRPAPASELTVLLQRAAEACEERAA